MNIVKLLMALAGLLAAACQSPAKQEDQAPGLNQIAERYVKTVLQLGQYDPDFVDAYYGPEAWKPSSPPADTFPATRFLQELASQQQHLAPPIPFPCCHNNSPASMPEKESCS